MEFAKGNHPFSLCTLSLRSKDGTKICLKPLWQIHSPNLLLFQNYNIVFRIIKHTIA